MHVDYVNYEDFSVLISTFWESAMSSLTDIARFLKYVTKKKKKNSGPIVTDSASF